MQYAVSSVYLCLSDVAGPGPDLISSFRSWGGFTGFLFGASPRKGRPLCESKKPVKVKDLGKEICFLLTRFGFRDQVCVLHSIQDAVRRELCVLVFV